MAWVSCPMPHRQMPECHAGCTAASSGRHFAPFGSPVSRPDCGQKGCRSQTVALSGPRRQKPAAGEARGGEVEKEEKGRAERSTFNAEGSTLSVRGWPPALVRDAHRSRSPGGGSQPIPRAPGTGHSKTGSFCLVAGIRPAPSAAGDGGPAFRATKCGAGGENRCTDGAAVPRLADRFAP